MSPHELLGFAVVYALAVASPGPGVAAIVARGLRHGHDGAAAFVAGFVVGDVIWAALTVLGLAALARSVAGLLLALKFAGAAYLLWLAWRLWTAPPAPVTAGGVRAGSPFLAGLALTLGNPKSMVFYFAIVPVTVPLATIDRTGIGAMFAIVAIVNPLILGSYAFAAGRAQRLLADGRRLRVVNRVFGLLLLVAAVALVAN